MRKTKIVCTLGPATDDIEVLRSLVREGMDVARFNFSHGSHEEQKRRLELLRQIREEEKRPIAALLDTKGPEIRIGKIENDSCELTEGQTFVLAMEEMLGNQQRASVSFPELYKDVEPGSRILIDDGLIELSVQEVKGTDIYCSVKNGGKISNNKGINAPDINVSLPYISEKDRQDILFAVENDYDFIAASFVRTREDLLQVRRILTDAGCTSIKLIAKIENKQGVENIDEIIDEADGVMIARGDMGVEIAGEEVPILQKKIIKKVCHAGKQVITATQMLDSMMKNPRPTRAETTDVANAIYDGTSAIMLSGETAAGKYPVEALKTMVRITVRAEDDIDYRKRFFHLERKTNPDITDAISHATCTTAYDLNARAILTVTMSGRSARMVSRYRPACDIIGCTLDANVSRQLNLSWGVKPLLLEKMEDAMQLFDYAVKASEQKGYLEKGDIAVITSGVPIGISGTTNMIKVQTVD